VARGDWTRETLAAGVRAGDEHQGAGQHGVGPRRDELETTVASETEIARRALRAAAPHARLVGFASDLERVLLGLNGGQMGVELGDPARASSRSIRAMSRSRKVSGASFPVCPVVSIRRSEALVMARPPRPPMIV